MEINLNSKANMVWNVANSLRDVYKKASIW